jgi:cold shock CspA family protein
VVRGLIEAFDDHRGGGMIRTDEGEHLYFHCVNIADGSRSIAPGTIVSVRRGVGHLGHDEAFEIVPESPPE